LGEGANAAAPPYLRAAWPLGRGNDYDRRRDLAICRRPATMPEMLRFLFLVLAISAPAVLAAPPSVTPAFAEKAKTDPCADTKMKSACKNSEAVRSLLRTSDPPPDKSKADASKTDKSKAEKSGEGVLAK
jgi:hypothetical protein